MIAYVRAFVITMIGITYKHLTCYKNVITNYYVSIRNNMNAITQFTISSNR